MRNFKMQFTYTALGSIVVRAEDKADAKIIAEDIMTAARVGLDPDSLDLYTDEPTIEIDPAEIEITSVEEVAYS